MTWIDTLASSEMLVPLAVVSISLALLLSILRYDFTVFVCFCLLGLVRIEPAPFDVLVLLLLGVGLLTRKLSLNALRGSSLVHVALWIFLAANIASLAATATFSGSLRFLITTVYLIAFAYFVKMYVTSYRAMRIVMMGYLVSVTINIVLIGLGYLGIAPFSELFIESGTRAVGAFKDSNVFGPFCIPIVLLLIDEILYPQFLPRFTLAKVVGVVVFTSAVFLSFSRATWANLAVALVIYFLLSYSRVFTFKRSSVLTGGMAALLVAAGGWQIFERLSEQLHLKEFLAWRISYHDYDAYRFLRQQEGIEAGLTRLFGVGPGTWDYAHSLYVRTLAEHGVFGFFSLVVLIGVLMLSTFRRALYEVSKPYGLSARVVLACLGGLVLNSFVIDTIHWRHFWLILALAWTICTLPGPGLPSQWRPVND